MKTARTHKILALLVLLVLSFTLAVFGMQFSGVKAATSLKASDYFVYSAGDITSNQATFENDCVKAPLKTGDKIKIKNNVVVDDFEIKVKVPANATKFVLTAKTASYDVNGNEHIVEGFAKFKTDIVNTLTINANGTATFNQGSETLVTATDGVYTIKLNVTDNFMQATVNGTAMPTVTYAKYKIADYDKVIATVEMGIDLPQDATEASPLYVEYVDQKVSDVEGDFKQTFKLNATGDAIEKKANPVMSLNAGFTKIDETTGKIIAPMAKENILVITQNAVIPSTKTVKLTTSDSDKVWLSNSSTYIMFKAEGEASFSIVDSSDNTVYETYNVLVKNEGYDGEGVAPIYNGDAEALKAFKAKIEDKLKDDDGNYIRIGSTQYLELPSLKSMVTDNVSAYEDLSFTLCYKTPTEEKEVSGNRIPLASAGKYQFFVRVTDERGNGMKNDDFFTTDNSGNKIFSDTCTYADYVFEFEILDNAPIKLTAASSQGDGYIGVKYTATSFTIEASAYEQKYKLLYSATKDAPAEQWVEIPTLDNVSEDYSENGFTYADVKAIAYDGNLGFTPDRAGYYKIECTITSTTSSRVTATATTTAISIQDKPQVVVAQENDWLSNNVWSVVFLGVGTLCLVAIIVLLCIKPKEETDTANRSRRKK
ncbi:MAG: hypothetical protein E7362_05455 [Clostridiales bacterium]|nr:hypothetical protein [Clostridiales bacterium]